MLFPQIYVLSFVARVFHSSGHSSNFFFVHALKWKCKFLFIISFFNLLTKKGQSSEPSKNTDAVQQHFFIFPSQYLSKTHLILMEFRISPSLLSDLVRILISQYRSTVRRCSRKALFLNYNYLRMARSIWAKFILIASFTHFNKLRKNWCNWKYVRKRSTTKFLFFS